MAPISLDQQNKRIQVKSFEIENEIVFNFFDKQNKDDYEPLFKKALYIGVMALMQNRLSAFLAKTTNELGTELESLKILFDMKMELFYKSTVKGTIAETEIEAFLVQFFKGKKIKDRAELTGNTTGVFSGNKTGDIICMINGTSDMIIAIECKFDKSISMDAIGDKDIFKKKPDSAWSQLLEAHANRDGKISLMIFDRSIVHKSITDKIENVGYIAGVGLIAIVDSLKGDYSNLAIAYMLARDIAINAREVDLDKDILGILITRIIKDIEEIKNIKKLVETNIKTNKQILCQLEKSMLLMEFNQEYLIRFLAKGTLSKKDLLDFYVGEDVKAKYLTVEKDIMSIGA